MNGPARFLFVLGAILSPTIAFETNSLSSTVSQCTTQYLSSQSTNNDSNRMAPGFAAWISTDSYTTSAYSQYAKTEVLTPRASTTIISATSTSIYYETLSNNLTVTIYTSTVSDTSTQTVYEAVTSTTTVIVSAPETITIPTPVGFTPIASNNPSASVRPSSTDISDKWDVEDAWWTTYSQNIYYMDRVLPMSTGIQEPAVGIQEPAVGSQEPDLGVLEPDLGIIEPPNVLRARRGVLIDRSRMPYRPQQPDPAQKVICTYTVISNYFVTTATSKRSSAPTPTFTRTSYVETITSTSTIRTKPTTSVPTTVSTYYADYASWTYSTTTTTITTVDMETTTETVYGPSTTPAYAACGADNLVDTYKGFPFSSLGGKWYDYSGNNTEFTVESLWSYNSGINSVQDCCARAAANESTIFFTYNGGSCDIYRGNKCPAGNSLNSTESASKLSVDVFYEPIPERTWYSSFTIGNGLCGSVNFQSLWEE